ncbi:hypothetical protein ABMA28_016036 [Loxostege sticticalis]|uniref:Uncharacterized protein n=1 Tax=Loxostege sticticalis TaxID=481309 RepID=A0ABD0T7F6_LOXSC
MERRRRKKRPSEAWMRDELVLEVRNKYKGRMRKSVQVRQGVCDKLVVGATIDQPQGHVGGPDNKGHADNLHVAVINIAPLAPGKAIVARNLCDFVVSVE